MKILFVVYSRTDTCSFYRSAGIAPDLRKKLNATIDIKDWNNPFDWASLLNYDLVYLQKPHTDMALQMIYYLKSLNIPVWVDYDDNLLQVPPDSIIYERYNDYTKQVIQNIIRVSDAVSVTTNLLRTELITLSDNIQVIPNAFNDYIFQTREEPPKRQKCVAWRGSDTHIPDIKAFKSRFGEAIGKHPDWVFAFMGVYLEQRSWTSYQSLLIGESPNIRCYTVTDPMFYFGNVSRLAPVLFHVPLKDNVFNRCKSNIAFIEAAQFGCICIAPAWEEWVVPGSLRYNNPEEYYNLIEFVIDDALKGGGYSKTMTELAWEYVSDTLRLSKINEKRVEIAQSLIS